MLILTRKTGQAFSIGEDITVTITEIAGDKVKIGIDAPKDCRVLREELWQTMKLNQQAASSVNGSTLRALTQALRQPPAENGK